MAECVPHLSLPCCWCLMLFCSCCSWLTARWSSSRLSSSCSWSSWLMLWSLRFWTRASAWSLLRELILLSSCAQTQRWARAACHLMMKWMKCVPLSVWWGWTPALVLVSSAPGADALFCPLASHWPLLTDRHHHHPEHHCYYSNHHYILTMNIIRLFKILWIILYYLNLV